MKKFILTTAAVAALSTGFANAQSAPDGLDLTIAASQQSELRTNGFPSALVMATGARTLLINPDGISANDDDEQVNTFRASGRVSYIIAERRAELREAQRAADLRETNADAIAQAFADTDTRIDYSDTQNRFAVGTMWFERTDQAGATAAADALRAAAANPPAPMPEPTAQDVLDAFNAQTELDWATFMETTEDAPYSYELLQEADALRTTTPEEVTDLEETATEAREEAARMEAERLARINARNAAKAKLNRMIGDDLQSSLLLETTESVFDNQYINDARITIRPEVGEVAIKLASSETFETPTHTLKATAQVRAGILGLGKDYSGTTHGLKLEGSAQAKDSETSYSLGYDSGTAYSYKGGKSGDFSGLKGNGRTDSSFYAGVSHTQTNGVKWGGKLDTDGVLDVELSKNGYSLGANSEGQIKAGYTITF